ncbi:hypothetical protein HMPREF2863_10035 [Micrococcus sp. HMSC067E09]|uniref:hypothetical protein n=2 Tax=Micrococcus TaxID=1269 RepID=UPI0008A2E8E5|nr:hypothetical protein [Micrococcus sp. HMSC067E09]OFR89092.1 hypothetical protein HMPREF2863_10035 [Micrococcus sp. HMSC067E09]
MVVIGVIVALAMLLGAGAWWGAGSFAARGSHLADLMANFHDDTELRPRSVTSDVCPDEGCRDAWRTSVGTYLEFEDADEARRLKEILGDDARVNDRVVLDLTGVELDRRQMERAVDLLFADEDWS